MNWLDPIRPYLWAVKIGLVAAALAWAGFRYHAAIERADRAGYARAVAEFSVQRLAYEKQAADRLAAQSKQLEDAQNAAIEREKELRGVVAAAVDASEQLRGANAKIRAMLTSTNTSCPALRLSGLALSSVFDDCAEKYRGMAEIADRHASDVRRLRDAWPR